MTTSTINEAAERERFQTWMRKECGADAESLQMRSDGSYIWGRTGDMWASWKESRATLPQASGEAVAYADPQAFENFAAARNNGAKGAGHSREWMWANPDHGLVPLFATQPTPASECCDTPSYCSSVRRCTAKDEAKPAPEMQASHGAPIAFVLDFVPEPPSGIAEEALSADEFALYSAMSDISEERWFAGWMDGNEYALWSTLQDGEIGDYNRNTLAYIAAMSVKTGKWIVWRSDADPALSGPQAIPLIDWLAVYDAKNDMRTPAIADSAHIITPWQNRMAAHYAHGSAQCHPAEHFMKQEVADWRASANSAADAPAVVCPARDVECGDFRQAWCATCPKWFPAATHPSTGKEE